MFRLSIFAVMLFWTLDKFYNPEHAANVYQHFYHINDLSPTVMYAIGAAELLLLLAFVVGYRKRLTYGLILIFHAISTFSSYREYLDPFNNLLYLAAWPMLAGCFALYYLRDLDTQCTLNI